MKIILDERETALFEKCNTLINTNPTSIHSLSKMVLPLGDVSITTDDDKEIILIERKSLADLLSSIKDGRYEEQSYRLIHSDGLPQPHHIIYVIEGIISQLRNPAEKKMVYSAMTTLNIFKGFSVIRTSSVQETAEWILATTNKLGKEMAQGKMPWNQTAKSTIPNIDTDNTGSIENAVIAPSVANYCSVVKKVKKENVTPANMGEIILCQIPGINSVSAITIMKHFTSISHLMRELSADPTRLDKIMCDANGKTRKLSKAVIQNIKTYLLYENNTL